MAVSILPWCGDAIPADCMSVVSQSSSGSIPNAILVPHFGSKRFRKNSIVNFICDMRLWINGL